MKRTSISAVLTVALVLLLALAAPAATVNCSGVAAWSPNSVAYAAGALVTYSGSEYKCIQAHTSQAGWDPADVPALWSRVGTCSSGGSGPTPTPTPTPTATAGRGTPTPTPTATPTSSGGGNCWPAWNANTIYNGGAQHSKNGENYQAAYWTQGNDPTAAGNSGPAGSGAYWIPEGSCSGSGSGGGTPTPTATPTATAKSGTPTPTPTATAT